MTAARVVSCFVLIASAESAPALDWQPATGARSAKVALPREGKPGFARLPGPQTGITFSNAIAVDRYTTNQIYLNGSGVAAGDVDDDGHCDVFFSGLAGQSRFYRNQGNWKFAEATREAGITCERLDASGTTFADIDGDSDLDLIVNSVGGGTWIFANDGKGRFAKLAELNPRKGGASLALSDIDGDGDLDLYVANYRTVTMRDEPNAPFRVNQEGGRTVILEYKNRRVSEPDLEGRFAIGERGQIVENGEADVLFRNDGGGRFTALSFTDGTFLDEEGQPLRSPPYDWGLSVMMRDMNGDGAPDIYVCNDFASPDRIWLNTGNGKFRAIARTALRHTSMFSMGVDFADLDRDGLADFFVVDMLAREHLGRHVQIGGVPPYLSAGLESRPQYANNTLFRNRGDGTFAELAWFAGVESSEWSWAPIFLDVDLDGYEDLLITNGHERDAMNADVMDRAETLKAGKKLSDWELLNLNNLFARLDTPNVAYRNRGNLTFEDVSAAWGFDKRGVSHGMCLADLDNDGDMDVVMNNLNEEAGVYRNEGSGARVGVRLKGNAPNTAGIGARIRVRGGAVERQEQEMICGGRYLSGDQAMRVFAAGSGTNRLSIEVTWRNGRRSVVSNAEPNRIYELAESAAVKTDGEARPEIKPWFEDVSPLIGHRHVEGAFNDFERQALLPWRLSQLGPGVGWHDVDSDGWEDLVIGSGKGGTIGVYRNDTKGGFTRLTNGPLSRVVSRDQTGVVGMGGLLLVGSANYEDGLTNGGAIRIYDVGRGASGEAVLSPPASTGPVALGDVDNDGDLDLFVGGRAIGGRYPEGATSQLLRNEGGRFVVLQKFEQVGLVSGAVWSDLDGDGDPELIAACEWGSIQIFRNEAGKLTRWDPEVPGAPGRRLSQLTGWWHGVTTGDLDGDGRLDIIASNWGKNSRYTATEKRPWKLLFGDVAKSDQVDLIEARWDGRKDVPERSWRMVRSAFPFLQEKMPGYESYGRAGVAELYGEDVKSLRTVEVNTVTTMALLNRGEKFEAAELPEEAQWSPAFGVCVADADGDGSEDVFLAQNFFAMNPEMGRHDAGRGLWLKGDGKGKLQAMPGQVSGMKVYGEQRGCAVADFDSDGRIDIAVTQNGADTKLYRNAVARPGLRVRLKGPPGNPAAVGAALRIEYNAGKGPAREIHSGSGYLSQDGAVQVLGMREAPTAVWVRWPGGKETSVKASGSMHELEISVDGQDRVVK